MRPFQGAPSAALTAHCRVKDNGAVLRGKGKTGGSQEMSGAIVEAMGNGCERLLRWLFPGAFFVILLSLSWPPFYQSSLVTKYGLPSVFAIGLTAGFIIYIVQAQIIAQVIGWFAIFIRWDVTLFPSKQSPEIRYSLFRFLAERLCNPWAQATMARYHTKKQFEGYFRYQFAIFHAMMITAWLPVFFRIFLRITQVSTLPLWAKWSAWWFPLSLIGFFGIILFLYLTRLDRSVIQNDKREGDVLVQTIAITTRHDANNTEVTE